MGAYFQKRFSLDPVTHLQLVGHLDTVATPLNQLGKVQPS